MGTVNLECRDSFNVFPDGEETEHTSEILLLRRENGISLRFELPVWLTAREVQKAWLVLFKVPSCWSGVAASVAETPERYMAFPLRSDATPFGGAFAPPRVDRRRAVRFCNCRHHGYTEIDVTGIVRAWADGVIVNRGFWLTGCQNARTVVYASSRSVVPGVGPLLRLHVENMEPCSPFCEAPCTVRVENGPPHGHPM